ncbi:MAG: hypothetical protein JWQ96_684 [Segetibacter sp.]|jgi:hypothetical protein|nr:hypothetical protein [Segetibacter sp.]
MSVHYPLRFTLEDGVLVEVNKTGDNLYDFLLRPEHGGERHFTLDNNKTKAEIDASLDFDQLNAVRRFWLEQEGI